MNGRVSALLELGAGFNPEFTGRDNVYLNGSILGLTTRQIDQRYEDIEAFAEIGDFINQPVKTYSSGMVVRLAFAVAINVDPEILLVDEALAVGDIYFRQRCMRKVHELRARGITILFVSHAIADVKAIGDRALWLDHGRVRGDRRTRPRGGAISGGHGGKGLRVPDAERRAEARAHRAAAPARRRWSNTFPTSTTATATAAPKCWVSRCSTSRAIRSICCSRRSASLCASACAPRISRSPIVGFMMRNQLGHRFLRHQHRARGLRSPPMTPGDVCTVDFHLDLPELYPASFSFSPAIADGTAAGLRDVRLDRQRHRPADGARAEARSTDTAPALPRGSECAPGAWRPS